MMLFIKLAKAELMTQDGYKAGDFTLRPVGLSATIDKSTKRANSVFALFGVYSSPEGQYEGAYYYKLFDYGYVTPKGYKSAKAIPVTVPTGDGEYLTLEQVRQLLPFKAEYRLNTFDPFYHENEARRRNAAGWAAVARDHMNDPYDRG